MNDSLEDVDAVKEVIDKERTNLFTVIAALAFLTICLFVSNITTIAYGVNAISEREALSIALDDQRLQYYQCVNSDDMEAECAKDLVSPNSRDIKRNLDGTGFTTILYAEASSDNSLIDEPEHGGNREAFGVLGYVIYGN